MTVPMPIGFSIVIDDDLKQLDAATLFGGSPARLFRLSPAGTTAWQELQVGPVNSRPSARLARTLTDACAAHPVPPRLMTPPDVTVVIPVRDRPDELSRCLASLSRAFPVIVIDDASRDELAVRAAAAAHGARLLRLTENVGPAAARNIGTTEVDTELIAYVDSDTVPGYKWIEDLARYFADPLVAAVAPRIVPLAADTAAGRYTRARCNLDLGARAARVLPYGRVSYVPTAALLVRRKVANEAGGPTGPFDATMPIGEDVDLVWRLHEAGWRIFYDPRHTVLHQEPVTWRSLLRRRHVYGTSSPMLAVRHPDGMTPLILDPWQTASVVALATCRPGLTVVGVAATYLRVRRAHRADFLVPPGLAARWTVHGIVQTWLGLGRYLIQFAPALLVAGMVSRRFRLAAAALTAAPPVAEWLSRGRPQGLPQFVGGYLADEVAYGAGVVSQSVRERTMIPLRPIVRRRSR